jgi:hypothetical protein
MPVKKHVGGSAKTVNVVSDFMDSRCCHEMRS